MSLRAPSTAHGTAPHSTSLGSASARPTHAGEPSGDNDDEVTAEPNAHVPVPRSELELPPLGDSSPAYPWSEVNEKQLRSALIGACKRMPRNAEAHFHLGLMYMRRCDGDEALRAFQHCRSIYKERLDRYARSPESAPPQLKARFATLRAHAAQAAHLAATMKLSRDERAELLARLQKDLVAATNLDNTQPHIWNALALLHLNEGGYEGAREVLRSIRHSFPEYLDALNNLGLAELALGNAEAAISCFQKVIVMDRNHAEALSNYGLVLLRHAVYESAARAFEGAVQGIHKDTRGLAFAWGGLAISHAAVGKFMEAEKAAAEAERTADVLSRPKFSLLFTSIRARRVTQELRDGVAAEQAVVSVKAEPSFGPAANANNGDPRSAMDSAVLRLRSLARDIGTSYASTALGAVLRLRHDFSWEETGNRNFGAESAERLVEALEKDNDDAAAWVQLALLQLGTGRYTSSRDFSVQAVSRNGNLESAWNALAVSSQLNDSVEDAQKAYARAMEAVVHNYTQKGPFSHDEGGDNTINARSDRIEQISSSDVPLRRGQGRRRTSPVKDEVDGDIEMLQSDNLIDHADRASHPDGSSLSSVGKQALAVLYCNLGNLRRQDGRSFADAQAMYKKSLEIGGENAAVYNNLALLYISANRFADADRMLDHALKLQPHFECAMSNQLKLKALMQQSNTRNRFGLVNGQPGGGMTGMDLLGDDVDEDDEDDEEVLGQGHSHKVLEETDDELV